MNCWKVFKSSIRFFLVVLAFSSCSLPKVYKASIGITSNNVTYKTVEDGKERALCVEEVNQNVEKPQKCNNGGYKEDKGISYWEPSIEFMPTYFGNSSFGFSYFLSANNTENTLLDYPVTSEKASISINRISVNPILFYNIGDRFITNKSGISFRFGLGGAINYVYNFQIERINTGEKIKEENKFKPGWATFVELSWLWFTFKVEHSQTIYSEEKFSGIPADDLRIENNKATFGYSYYF